jgi:hypothetical protein
VQADAFALQQKKAAAPFGATAFYETENQML